MQAERWQQVEKLFHAALEQASHERVAYLRATSNGDLELQREVESLLVAHEVSGRLETAASELAAEWLEGQQPLVGQTLGHFQILAPLGSGGMGEVYLAEDIRLGRKVALKLLPAQLTADAERLRRFEQEARAASALNHPNILTIHEIGEADDRYFIVSEFVEGQTLRARMASARMQLGEALEVATQAAGALAAAHAAGIVHRDIKPENLMLRPDGYVKVLDFGLAKLTEPPALAIDTQALTAGGFSTESGVVMGTVHYMSPEQARGQKVDARSDIFSLGIVLYEMITGRAPFEGATSSDVIAALLAKEPLPLSQFLPEIPVELEQIVTKALRKDREERYQTIKDLLLDLKGLRPELDVRVKELTATSTVAAAGLRWLRSRMRLAWAAIIVAVVAGLGSWFLWRDLPAGSQPEIRSLAVLPFKSLNQESKEDYLGLGIANEIITKVSQSGELTVRPSSAVRKYVNLEMDALASARELKVDAVLDSTFLHVGDQLRVTVNLLRVADGVSLWAEKFDERFTDIFAIHDKVSQQVAQRLRLKLSPAQQARLTKRYTSNPEAYNYYVKAMYHSGNLRGALRTRSESNLTVDLFKKAIELDPNYALAHAQLGYVYAFAAAFQEDNPALIEQAKQEVDIAERLDPQLAEVHAARYFILFSKYGGWQVEAAFRELRLAQQLDPNVGHEELGNLYSHIGLEKQAVEELEIALKANPNNDPLKNFHVDWYFESARPDEGLEASKRFFNRGTDFRYYLEKRMVREAAPLVEEAYQKDPNSFWALRSRALLLALQGKHQEAQAAIPVILEKLRRNQGYHHLTYNSARIYALGGKSAEALKWLRVTVQEGFPCYPVFARDPFLDLIRKDPAFLQFMEEMKTRWEGYQREFG
jgi:eukaryotic-like serine/threonine-protein kinase